MGSHVVMKKTICKPLQREVAVLSFKFWLILRLSVYVTTRIYHLLSVAKNRVITFNLDLFSRLSRKSGHYEQHRATHKCLKHRQNYSPTNCNPLTNNMKISNTGTPWYPAVHTTPQSLANEDPLFVISLVPWVYTPIPRNYHDMIYKHSS